MSTLIYQHLLATNQLHNHFLSPMCKNYTADCCCEAGGKQWSVSKAWALWESCHSHEAKMCKVRGCLLSWLDLRMMADKSFLWEHSTCSSALLVLADIFSPVWVWCCPRTQPSFPSLFTYLSGTSVETICACGFNYKNLYIKRLVMNTTVSAAVFNVFCKRRICVVLSSLQILHVQTKHHSRVCSLYKDFLN